MPSLYAHTESVAALCSVVLVPYTRHACRLHGYARAGTRRPATVGSLFLVRESSARQPLSRRETELRTDRRRERCHSFARVGRIWDLSPSLSCVFSARHATERETEAYVYRGREVSLTDFLSLSRALQTELRTSSTEREEFSIYLCWYL
jgi:hypothetical protein